MYECEVCGEMFEKSQSLAAHARAGHGQPWKDEQRMREEYLENGKSITELSDEFDCGRTTIARWLDRHDIPTRPSTHEKPPSVHVLANGYEYVTVKTNGEQKHAFIHRLLAVACGKLSTSEFGDRRLIIHHKNQIPWDNRPENIEVMGLAEHSRHHSQNRERGEDGTYG